MTNLSIRLRMAVAAALGVMALTGLMVGEASAATTYVSSFGGPGTGSAQFSDPRGVAINDDTGEIFVADTGNHRIQVFDSSGNFLRMWGEGVNQTIGADLCTAVSGNVCKAGLTESESGAFSSPWGVAVDNSNGSSDGSVYVQDKGNNRVQRFTSGGAFVLMWGKEVNLSTGGNICTAASGDLCKGGDGTGGGPAPGPGQDPPPDPPGSFRPFEGFVGPSIGVDGSGNVYVGDPAAEPHVRVQKFTAGGAFLSQIASETRVGGISTLFNLAINSDGDAYVVDSSFGGGSQVSQYPATAFTPEGDTAQRLRSFDSRTEKFADGPRRAAVHPYQQFLFAFDSNIEDCPSGAGSLRIREFHPAGGEVDCSASSTAIDRNDVGGVAAAASHRLYLTDTSEDRIHRFDTPIAAAPVVGNSTVSEVTSTSARIDTEIAANLLATTFHIEYGTVACSIGPCQSTAESDSIGAAIPFKTQKGLLEELAAGTAYHYRVVATNAQGTIAGPDRKLRTFATPETSDCPNSLARQQTGAPFLLDCRAYELVSAENSGGYNVASDLLPGQEPYGGYPLAEGKVLYAVQDGGVLDVAGNPTNRGPDPYVATRDDASNTWKTSYVGLPSDAPSFEPFSSTLAGADSGLGVFAFGGDEICDPCFPDGSAGMPVRTPGGALVQGMAASIPVADPEPSGEIRKHLSGDGSHFLFGSTQQFEPAGNSSGTDLTIYDRDFSTGTTQVASTLPDGSTIAAGMDVAALDVSADGSRVLIGSRVSTDSEGNDYFDLFMHIGSSPNSVEVADTPGGVLYAGMSADGVHVLFTTADQLDDDADSSIDLFRATVAGSATIERVSRGIGTGNTDSCDPVGNSFNFEDWNTVPGGPTDCSVAAVPGGGGVAADSGDAYFLSPEQLEGSGVDGAPNLFRAGPGGDPVFVGTLESGASAPIPPPVHNFESYLSGGFVDPIGAAIDDSDGSIYALDLNGTMGGPGAFVRKFDALGNPDGSFAGDSYLNGADGPNSQLSGLADGSVFGFPSGFPTSIAVDNRPASPNYRDLFVPDFETFSVKRFSSSGVYEALYSIPPGFEFPVSVAINQENGNVYLGTVSFFGGGTVYAFTAGGAATPPTSFSTGGGTGAWGLGVGAGGNIYVARGTDTRVHNSLGGSPTVLDANASYGVAVDPADNHVYVDRGGQVVEYDTSHSQVSSPFGAGKVSESIGLAVASGRVVASNPPGNNYAIFAPPATEPNRAYDHPLVIAALRDAEIRRTGHFQTTPDGEVAVFASTLPLTGAPVSSNYNVFRHDDASSQLVCVSCSPAELPSSTDATLATNGLSVADDGRVFFTTGDRLVQRDTNGLKDAYEWLGDRAELISTGTSSFDSGLLSVTDDGRDAFFFTRDTLAANDDNGSLMKVYDAREDGGFFLVPPSPPCAASDECHGPGSAAPDPPNINTIRGTGGNLPAVQRKKCKRGFVRKRGKCVRKRKGRRAAGRRAGADRGGLR